MNNGLEATLAERFSILAEDLEEVKYGPTDGWERWIEHRRPMSCLPPPSLTLLLMVVIQFLAGFKHVKAWLARHVPLMEPSHELKLNIGGFRWTVINTLPQSYKDDDESYLHVPDIHETFPEENGRVIPYQNSEALADFVRSNFKQHDLLGRLVQFPELLFDDKGYKDPQLRYHRLINALCEGNGSYILLAEAIRELGRSGFLSVSEPEDGGGPEFGYGGRPFFKLGDAVLPHLELIDRYCQLWKTPANRMWLSTVSGDWAYAHALAKESGQVELAARMQRRAEQCQRDSAATLRRFVARSAYEYDESGDDVVQNLVEFELGIEDLPEVEVRR